MHLWQGESAEAVKELVESVVGPYSDNEYFEVDRSRRATRWIEASAYSEDISFYPSTTLRRLLCNLLAALWGLYSRTRGNGAGQQHPWRSFHASLVLQVSENT